MARVRYLVYIILLVSLKKSKSCQLSLLTPPKWVFICSCMPLQFSITYINAHHSVIFWTKKRGKFTWGNSHKQSLIAGIWQINQIQPPRIQNAIYTSVRWLNIDILTISQKIWLFSFIWRASTILDCNLYYFRNRIMYYESWMISYYHWLESLLF